MDLFIVTRTAVNVDDAMVNIVAELHEDQREDVPDFMLSATKNRLACNVQLATGIVWNWKSGVTCDLHLKVVDSGCYMLTAKALPNPIEMDGEYVPGGFPGEHYGDYLIFKIDAGGKIAGWNASKILESFQEYADESEIG